MRRVSVCETALQQSVCLSQHIAQSVCLNTSLTDTHIPSLKYRKTDTHTDTHIDTHIDTHERAHLAMDMRAVALGV